jgi:parallel beta-helix repeat protein
MNNKKILVSFLLVVLVALSVSAVSAADADDVIAVTDDDAVAIAVDDVVAVDYEPENNTVDDVQTAINLANKSGDTIDLSKYAEYDFADKGVNITNDNVTLKGNGNTTIKGYGLGNGLVDVTGSNVTIQGIKFVDTNPANDFKYNGTVSGWGVRFFGVTGGLVDNCVFTDFNTDIRAQRASDVIIQNSEFLGGYTTKLLNDPTVNKEEGTKALNIMGSTGMTIRNNRFVGPVLDAVSIASGSGSNVVENNYFEGNCYAIYFGGASTKGSKLKNNTFVNNGNFKEGDIDWNGLPVISIQKSSDGISIEDNTFEATNFNVLIAAEQGNEAHGFPTTIDNINITGNTVNKLTDDVIGRTVTFLHVLCRDNTTINFDAVFNLENNTLAEGVKEVVLWYAAWGDESEVILPVNNTAKEVQAAIDAANPGDVIDLAQYDKYDFYDSGVTINKENITLLGTGNTTIFGYGLGNGLVDVVASNVTIKGIKFIDTNPENNFIYNGTVAGWGVRFFGVNGGLIDGCSFTDFNTDVRAQRTNGLTIQNSEFLGGYTTYIRNDPTVNVETGTKALNIMGSSQITIKDNLFDGQVLDAISIASGSGSNVVENNVFVGNTYSIYFGGASTKGSAIRNNTFINCGYFKEENVTEWTELPVISIQKAANDISINDNTFEAVSDSILIAAEQGNEAHGFPSSLGNINVTGNTVKSFDNNTDAKTVTLFSILCRNGDLQLFAPINVTGNTLEENMKTCVVQTTGDTLLAPPVVPVIRSNTTISGSDFNQVAMDFNAGERGGFFVVQLKDANGTELVNKTVKIGFNGVVYSVTTNGTGHAKLQINLAGAGLYTFAVAFLGDDNYTASFEVYKITITKKSTSISAAAKSYKASAKTKSFTATLKTVANADGKTYLKEGKKVTVTVNGKTYTTKTDSKGQATFKLSISKKGKYTATVKFAGDSTYSASSKSVKITIK